ncbi:hypothetical protein [Phenylobacterium soli]|uniref:DUF5666 domain-containing protein n=1 Tax=Phenylobacterium soli TaxID=2170551 RepID=A0A328AKC2_9CAUL|nr:hypothetical protein [Phenylobacterium soli]RAK55049.1 hypothetical protein DJ017_11235 [Phenylobacterium soli]
MRILMGAAAVALLGLACAGCGNSGVSGAQAAESAPAAEQVTAVGCPKAPKPGCVTLTADGKTWDVTAAGVDLAKGVAVNVSGTAGPAGACGPTLVNAQVDYTGLQCKH